MVFADFSLWEEAGIRKRNSPRLAIALSVRDNGNALRVFASVTRLTVYRGLQVGAHWRWSQHWLLREGILRWLRGLSKTGATGMLLTSRLSAELRV